VELAAYRAATVLLLCAPETPLLFMGQEWAARTPFLYFTDHHAELGRQVTAGRRREFRHFKAFSDPRERERIPDPQSPESFARSRLDWKEVLAEPHAGIRRLHRELLRLRGASPLLRRAAWEGFRAEAAGETAVVLRYDTGAGSLVAVVQLEGAGEVALDLWGRAWSVVLHTEEARFTTDGQDFRAEPGGDRLRLRFPRPGGAIVELSPPSGS
jgi:maltooligosyltrehalose trehalohydrolase